MSYYSIPSAMAGSNVFISSVGGWKELGRVSSSGTLTVSGLANKRYYQVLNHEIFTASGKIDARLNNDSAANRYSTRGSEDGAADAAIINRTSLEDLSNSLNNPHFNVGYYANLSGKEKLAIIHSSMVSNTADATGAPSRKEFVGKWVNTADPIDRFDYLHTGIATADSELVVLGWDPNDTHTDNFWQQLANVTNSGVTDNLSSGTITAKKYLWIMAYVKPSGNNVDVNITFNNDTTALYNWRRSVNGATDVLGGVAQNEIKGFDLDAGNFQFLNMFIINRSASEKLVIIHSASRVVAGVGTAPSRMEMVGKWANTSAQITEIDIDNVFGGVDYTISGMVVWGAD